MKTVTQWFSGSVSPVRNGVYQRCIPRFGIRYSYWDGECWGGFAGTVESARLIGDMTSMHQMPPWRGLAEKPSK